MAAPATLAVEARLDAILEPYRVRLELATIYDIPTLRKQGARGHHWFAFVKPATKYVGFYLLPMVPLHGPARRVSHGGFGLRHGHSSWSTSRCSPRLPYTRSFTSNSTHLWQEDLQTCDVVRAAGAARCSLHVRPSAVCRAR